MEHSNNVAIATGVKADGDDYDILEPAMFLRRVLGFTEEEFKGMDGI